MGERHADHVPANPLRDVLAFEPVGRASSVRDRRVPVPDRLGLGIEIDPDDRSRSTSWATTPFTW